MAWSENPVILLIADDEAEASHTSHVLTKYRFTNLVVKLRKASDAAKYFAACNAPGADAQASLPELIILGLREAGRPNVFAALESRHGRLASIPLIIMVDSREEEDEIRRLELIRTATVSRPAGFFKLLEAMQKLGMRWLVLRPDP
jgi:DNA-binding response OmpR family regulator